jgi:hypothetical protein
MGSIRVGRRRRCRRAEVDGLGKLGSRGNVSRGGRAGESANAAVRQTPRDRLTLKRGHAGRRGGSLSLRRDEDVGFFIASRNRYQDYSAAHPALLFFSFSPFEARSRDTETYCSKRSCSPLSCRPQQVKLLVKFCSSWLSRSTLPGP